MAPNPLDEETTHSGTWPSSSASDPGPQPPRSDRHTQMGPGPAVAATTSPPAAAPAPTPVDDATEEPRPTDGKLPPLTPILDHLKTMGTGQTNRDRVAAVYAKHRTIVPFLEALVRGDEGVPNLTAKKTVDFVAEVVKKRKGK